MGNNQGWAISRRMGRVLSVRLHSNLGPFPWSFLKYAPGNLQTSGHSQFLCFPGKTGHWEISEVPRSSGKNMLSVKCENIRQTHRQTVYAFREAQDIRRQTDRQIYECIFNFLRPCLEFCFKLDKSIGWYLNLHHILVYQCGIEKREFILDSPHSSMLTHKHDLRT